MKHIYTLLEQSKEELNIYIDILKKWQKAVNLIAPSTLSDIWNRHIVDSAQLYPLISDNAKVLCDMGSGAGFPGIVLSILNKKNVGHLKQIILIESDMKKCLFLKEVVRELSLPVEILNTRIENIQHQKVDILTARALSSLQNLLVLGKNLIDSQTICLFLKGENVDEEIQKCTINCQIEKIKSITNSNSSILKVTEVLYD
ncbi:MAG: 16S rRNA (guanine(527)-N(7))-methyltransferase RsmG [Alphaproteobacteria bacterium]|nr:16S rRNA (guanine(527)-N(7))-methyltransferase RsmG [Alphaproteobacteria bacterium]